VTVTIMYQLLTRGINSTLEQAGISANLGPRVLAASWLAVAFSVGSISLLARRSPRRPDVNYGLNSAQAAMASCRSFARWA
jgi:hypothetical protein